MKAINDATSVVDPAKPLDDSQQQVLAAAAEKLDQAETCDDAGEKFLLLQQIAAETDSHLRKARESISARAGNRGIASYMGFAGSSSLIAGIALPFHLPLLFLIAVSGAIAGIFAGERGEAKARSRFSQQNRSYLEALEAHQAKASDLAATLLLKQPLAIVESKNFPTVLNTMPANLRADFAAALSCELAAARKSDAMPPKPLTGGFRL